jgi:hypothetical protein
MARGWSFPTTAIPNTGSFTFVMSRNLGGMGKYVVSHLAHNNRYAFVKFIRGDDIMCVPDGAFVHPNYHVL